MVQIHGSLIFHWNSTKNGKQLLPKVLQKLNIVNDPGTEQIMKYPFWQVSLQRVSVPTVVKLAPNSKIKLP